MLKIELLLIRLNSFLQKKYEAGCEIDEYLIPGKGIANIGEPLTDSCWDCNTLDCMYDCFKISTIEDLRYPSQLNMGWFQLRLRILNILVIILNLHELIRLNDKLFFRYELNNFP